MSPDANNPAMRRKHRPASAAAIPADRRSGPSLTLLTAAASIVAGAFALANETGPAKTAPNIVILYADDLGYGDLSCQNPDSKIPTPHLDRLASEGLRLTDAHSSSGICTPSRYALLTGRYHWRKTHDIVRSFEPPVIGDSEVTLPELLRSGGYRTACFGKWHLGWNWAAIRRSGANADAKRGYPPDAFDWAKPIPGGPLSHGFDEYFGDDVPNFPPYAWIEGDRCLRAPDAPMSAPRSVAEGEWELRPGPMVSGWDFHAVMPTITARATEWIRSQRDAKRPFFLYVAFTSPHTPIVPSPEFAGKASAGAYGDFVAQTDWAAGQILAALDESGLAENTLVIFSSDNGPEHYAYERARDFDHHSAGPLRGVKRDLWEGGHRVPFIVRWDGVTKPGTVSDGLLSQIDLMATLATAAGIPLPDTAATDSLDQTALLRGGPSSRSLLVHNTSPGRYALREGNWVLIDAPSGTETKVPAWAAERLGYGPASGKDGLYDLSSDLGQSRDAALDQPERVRSMRAKLDTILRSDRTRTKRPNIVLIMPDDMGYGDLAVHGNPVIQTPHLDALHARSVRFTDFHASPTCAPSRAALMTGRHEFWSGVTHTILERERMDLSATTLAQVLQGAGYATGIFGKWHLGDEAPYRPDQRGFDEVVIHGGGGIGQTFPGSGGDFPRNGYFDPHVLHNDKIVKTEGYCTDVFFSRAIRWMDERRRTGAPFFAYITPNAPHAPLVSPGPEYERRYIGKEIAGKPLSPDDVAYYAMITNIDDNIGALNRKLREWGIADDTLIVFLSDNGGTHTELYGAGTRGGKGTMYQGGTRVPSFWCWPNGGVGGGIDCPALASHIDVLPTMAQIAGATWNGGGVEGVDGRSILPLLLNAAARWPNRILVTHVARWAPGKADESKYAHCSIRDERYRLVENRALYDVFNDPGEGVDVIGDHPEAAARLRAAYEAWWASVRPRLRNETAVPPRKNAFKELFWNQFGGGPDAGMLRAMDPASIQ